MDLETLIIAGDLNYTLNLDEVWGRFRKADPLAGKIQNSIIMNNFVDVCPSKIAPTWDNRRSGSAYVAKRLDHFLIHEQLLDRLGDVWVNTISNFILNHRPITLQWRKRELRSGFPFKFSRTVLEEPDFNKLVHDTCGSINVTGSSPMLNILEKLESLRGTIKFWQEKRKLGTIERSL